MFYKAEKGSIISVDKISKGVNVAFLNLEEFVSIYQDYGFLDSCVSALRFPDNRYHGTLEVYDDFSFGIIHIMNLNNPEIEREKIGVFLKKDVLFLVFLEQNSEIKKYMVDSLGRTANEFTIEKVLFILFNYLIKDSNDILEKYENIIINLEKRILNNDFDKDFNRKLFKYKTGIMLRENFFDELALFVYSINENENMVFDIEENYRHLKIFANKVNRLSDKSKILCDGIVHVREVYQSALDYQLNNIIKLFTVVTTIFLPLTLIVGWYGMNFTSMPEITWKYGYLFVILLCISVVLGCVWFFKRKKLL
ncbi:MAG: CorA family divalent cation transporter [Erysipelotrichaceae bacterium]